MNGMDKLESYGRVHVEVDLDAIRYNMDSMRANLQAGTEMMAVIKADGYGHGSVPIGKELEDLPYLLPLKRRIF